MSTAEYPGYEGDPTMGEALACAIWDMQEPY